MARDGNINYGLLKSMMALDAFRAAGEEYQRDIKGDNKGEFQEV
jgi:hypothetical protein